MKVSASLVVDNTEEYRIGFETIETGFLQDEVFEYLNKEGVEIVEVLLERVKGSEKQVSQFLRKYRQSFIACLKPMRMLSCIFSVTT